MYIYDNFLPGKSRVFFRCHGNEYRRNDNFRFWVLVSTNSQIVQTAYFPMHSPIVIFAEYFVCFLDEIEYKQFLRKFTSVVNYIRCNLIIYRL